MGFSMVNVLTIKPSFSFEGSRPNVVDWGLGISFNLPIGGVSHQTRDTIFMYSRPGSQVVHMLLVKVSIISQSNDFCSRMLDLET